VSLRFSDVAIYVPAVATSIVFIDRRYQRRQVILGVSQLSFLSDHFCPETRNQKPEARNHQTKWPSHSPTNTGMYLLPWPHHDLILPRYRNKTRARANSCMTQNEKAMSS